MKTLAEKGEVFRALHQRSGAFIIPNPWDVGTARLLAHLGFEALATTSAGYAFSAGRPDSTVSREETLAHVEAIVSATDLPGADVLYAPGLTSKDDIATVVRSVDRPVNVLMGLQGSQLSLTELSALGVKRISVGSALSRAALGAFLRAAHELRDHGTFTFANDAISYRDITTIFESMR